MCYLDSVWYDQYDVGVGSECVLHAAYSDTVEGTGYSTVGEDTGRAQRAVITACIFQGP